MAKTTEEYDKKFIKYMEWKDTPQHEREIKTKAEWARKNGISKSTFFKWDARIEKLRVGTDDPKWDAYFMWLENKCSKGQANYNEQRLYAQLKGKLIEKVEEKLTIGLSADEITRRNIEAERQLRDGGYRVAQVQDERTILPDTVRVYPDEDEAAKDG